MKGSLGNSGGPRYALAAWARFELLGAPRGPCDDRTSAEDLHLNYTTAWTILYLLKFLNKQQHTDTGHQLQKMFHNSLSKMKQTINNNTLTLANNNKNNVFGKIYPLWEGRLFLNNSLLYWYHFIPYFINMSMTPTTGHAQTSYHTSNNFLWALGGGVGITLSCFY